MRYHIKQSRLLTEFVLFSLVILPCLPFIVCPAESADLQPYQRSSWNNQIVISNEAGSGTTSATIFDDENLYIDYGCVNRGSNAAGHFRYGLYVDGNLRKYTDLSGLDVGYASFVEDSALSPLPAGSHTFKVVCDYNNEVTESNESNNEYSRSYVISEASIGQETYLFKHMWPTLQQSWYFYEPKGIAIDETGNVYVTDSFNNRIQKYTLDGQFVVNWGKYGNGNGEFDLPTGIAVDSQGYVYVADSDNTRIQKFNSDGLFLAAWGTNGSGNGQFDQPRAIAVGPSGNIFVVDMENHRIQKFNAVGQFLLKWGSLGTGDGQFDSPEAITIDQTGNVYVADTYNHRIQKFTLDGNYLNKWGEEGWGDGQFVFPTGITFDSKGNVYVADWNSRISKFSDAGQFLAKWGAEGSGYGDLQLPDGIATSNTDVIFVADTFNNRIQKFTTNGVFTSGWGSQGSEIGQFTNPAGVAVDSDDNIYVVDSWNDRIQKFDSAGRFVTTWGNYGSEEGRFSTPRSIAIDHLGNVFVVERGNDRVQKFNRDGDFLSQWGSAGSDDGQFNNPSGIAVDPLGDVYVADNENNRIQKFTANGQFLLKWGELGTGNGQFDTPKGIATDHLGNVYVADSGNNRIQKFTRDGQFISELTHGDFSIPDGLAVDANANLYVADSGNNRIQKFASNGELLVQWGGHGNFPGQMNWPSGVAVMSNGDVIMTDLSNHRLQIFKQVTLDINAKAIVVAGGGPYPGNSLWDATRTCANFAYRTLSYQGYHKEGIQYLSFETNLDLDSNGEFDDIDDTTTNANLQQVITSWASDASSLVVYLVDHGGDGSFRMSGTEILAASDLDAWLDQLQIQNDVNVTVIYDACESGSFLSALIPPAGKERITITSTSSGESAYFVTQGSISFSNFFWTHIFNGSTIRDAFELTRDAIGDMTQHQNALLDANRNGIGNESQDYTLVQNAYIGNGTFVQGDVPMFDSVSPHQTINNINSALLYANGVTDDDGIARVWAVIRPPDFNIGSSDNPIQELPSIDLMPSGNDRYEATYASFDAPGTYQIAIYARDRDGNTARPELTAVTVNNPLKRRAILVAGGPATGSLWTAVVNSSLLAYEVLKFQGYKDEDIYFMSPVTFSAGVDGAPSISNIRYAVQTWSANNTGDVVLCLVGKGAMGSFDIGNGESLTAHQLDQWLDGLQQDSQVKVTVVYDACQSGSFLKALIPPSGKQRIQVASSGADQPACFLSNGEISFSKYFWSRILNGANVRQAFLHAKQAVEYTTLAVADGPILAQLDDNGNGIGNEKADGKIARNTTFGYGIMLAGDNPVIGSICPQQTVSAGSPANLWVDGVTTTGTIDRVWLVITPPGYQAGTVSDPITDLPVVDLSAAASYRYEGTFSDYTTSGTYQVTAYAMDYEGNISMPKDTVICNGVCSDDYEIDDSYDQANVIVINDMNAQQHNFHAQEDQDWVKFYAVAGETYTVEVSDTGSNCDAVIELYGTNGTSRITVKDDGGAGESEELNWVCPQDGIYFVKVRNYEVSVYGENTAYALKVYRPIGPLSGFVTGIVLDGVNQLPLPNARIKSAAQQTAVSLTDGNYLMVHPPGTVQITSQMDGYISATHTVIVSEGGSVTQNFILTPLDGDNDGVNDAIDNCPDISNADQSNNDNDLMGDVCDPDDDNDGMPDVWEKTYGLNPFINDAGQDKDGDGFSNISEYRRGTVPNDPLDFPTVIAVPWLKILLLDEE